MNDIQIDPFIDICVRNPVTSKFTQFEIFIQTNNPAFTLQKSCTRRRYKEFCWLRKMLRSHHPILGAPPEMPPKKMTAERFDVQFLAHRMKGLEEWLQRLTEVNLYLSDTTLHLFLQTRLSCDDIGKYLDGKLPEDRVQQAWKEQEAICEKNQSIFEESFDHSFERSGLVASLMSISIPNKTNSDRPKVPVKKLDDSDSESDVDSSYSSAGSSLRSSLSSVATDCYPALTLVSAQTVSGTQNSEPDFDSSQDQSHCDDIQEQNSIEGIMSSCARSYDNSGCAHLNSSSRLREVTPTGFISKELKHDKNSTGTTLNGNGILKSVTSHNNARKRVVISDKVHVQDESEGYNSEVGKRLGVGYSINSWEYSS